MANSLNQENKVYWQKYKPGEIPSVPKDPPEELTKDITGPILDVGTGDGVLAEKLTQKGFEVYGIDVAENIIAENQKRSTKVTYSVQDITKPTSFMTNQFELLIFRFTLTNIHQESWQELGKEANRILKPNGKVWVLEPLFSDSYSDRYELASQFVKDKNCVYVFFDRELAKNIKTREDLQKTIEEGKVSRVVKHYTVEELKSVFSPLELENYRIIEVTSPSGFAIRTFEGVFVKPE